LRKSLYGCFRISYRMAKKKRRIMEEPEEQYEFTPSEFDEREFILKDIYGTKVMFVVTIMAIVVGILASLIYRIDDGEYWWGGMLLSFFTVIIMKKLFMALGFRVDLLDFKTMLGNYLIFLILALGVCIVFVNAPFL
jgi:hypothetical protein